MWKSYLLPLAYSREHRGHRYKCGDPGVPFDAFYLKTHQIAKKIGGKATVRPYLHSRKLSYAGFFSAARSKMRAKVCSRRASMALKFMLGM